MMRKCVLLILILTCIQLHHSFAQSPDQQKWADKYRHLETEYIREAISEQQYVTAIDSMSEQVTVSGMRLSNEAFIGFMSRYRDIIWNDDAYKPFRANYFRFLMNHALASGRFGEALFYAEKNDKEATIAGKKTFLIPYMKLLIWAKSENNAKVIELYTEQREHLLDLLDRQPEDSTRTRYLQAMQFLVYVIKPLLQSGHPWAEEVKDNAIKMEALIQGRFDSLKGVKIHHSIPRLLSLFCNIEYYTYMDDRKYEKVLLDSAWTILQEHRENIGTYRIPYENILNSFSFNYYIKVKDNQHAAYYLSRLVDAVQIFDDERSNLYTYKAKLSFNQGDMRHAYIFLDSALKYKSEEFATASQEITRLMYAFTESEYNKAELQRANKKREAQNIWIISISVMATAMILIFYLYMRKVKKKSREQIAVLNRIADITIEEAKRYGAKEEQRKLGRDLHDDLSASLVSALHITELADQKSDPSEVFAYLKELKKRISTIYNTVRNKSHQIYRQATEEQSDHFEESVKRIMDAALSISFKGHINIEKEASQLLTIQQRIELMKILQEAIANVLKHSKANQVSVLLKQKNEQLVFQVSDNGIGFTPHANHLGFGLRSLKKRVTILKGKLELLNEDGLNLVITFPAEIHQR